MRLLTPRPVLLALALILITVAIAFVELRFDRAGSDDTRAVVDPPPAAQEEETVEPTTDSPPPADARTAAERVEGKEAEFTRAKEIVAPTGFVNTDGVSIGESLGDNVVLVQFWTYSCFNCKNTQPYLNEWYEEYEDEGLLVIGVHTPEFEFEKDPASVETAVEEANIEYPVVLDNDRATWEAYDQRYWPARYLIDADGFIRYRHFGEGAYEETEAKIRELLSERGRIPT